jgi:preprotein translocase subunit SecA
MGQIYRFLGLTVGVIVHGLDDDRAQEAYACDITYGTNNEFGFDYLRDNMKYRWKTWSSAAIFAIVDEVDSILIDEARTPLIISGPPTTAPNSTTPSTLIPKLTRPRLRRRREAAHGDADRSRHGEDRGAAARRRLLAQRGIALRRRERLGGPPRQPGAARHKLFQRDKDYIVRDGEVVIIDEFTGRMMQGRRYSEGLHQALEAKEHVEVQPENQTLASITFQNYFRLYEKLAGMTGTALTEADELFDIYKLESSKSRPTVPVARSTRTTRSIAPSDEKYARSGRDRARQRALQPVLVGTTSIEKSECSPKLSRSTATSRSTFERNGRRCKLYAGAARAGKPAKLFAVLNARFHEQEAYHRRRGRRARRDHHRHQHGRPRHRHQLGGNRSTCADPGAGDRRGSPRPRRPPRSSRSRPTSSASATSC